MNVLYRYFLNLHLNQNSIQDEGSSFSLVITRLREEGQGQLERADALWTYQRLTEHEEGPAFLFLLGWSHGTWWVLVCSHPVET